MDSTVRWSKVLRGIVIGPLIDPPAEVNESNINDVLGEIASTKAPLNPDHSDG
jgi:hypothetical protein